MTARVRCCAGPSPQEFGLMVAALVVHDGLSEGEARETLDAATIVMVDGYITDGPGYTGKVALVLYPGGPEMVDSFTFYDNGARIEPTTTWRNT